MLLKRGVKDPLTLHRAGKLNFSVFFCWDFDVLVLITFSLPNYYSTGNNSRSGGGGGQEVFVKGFDSSLAPNDIKSALTEHFASCGEITRVSVPVDRETGGSRGCVTLLSTLLLLPLPQDVN